jgi:GAF domain-containing protein/CBS domain-containing protein/ActR/RegA family two-component response regulator
MLNPVPHLTQSELLSAIVRQPLVVTPDTTVMATIDRMSGIRVVCAAGRDTSSLDELHLQARSSCVSIVEDGQIIGILTERDIVRLSAQQRDLGNIAIRDVMTTNVVTLRTVDFTDIFVAVNLLHQHHIRHLPVVDDLNCLVGLITHESLQQAIRPIDLLRLRLVSEVMTDEVICAAPDLSMLAIAQLMAAHRISSVIIVQLQMETDRKLLNIPVGIVTERDLVQFQALSLDLETCPAQAVMSTPIFAVNPSDSLWVVQQILEQRSIQRLAVTGDRGELLGIVTQSSLLQALNPIELYNLAEALETKVLRLEAEKIELLKHRTLDLEFQIEERTKKLTEKVVREQLVSKISTQIRSSLNLTEILDTAVRELQSILGCDRVSIWKFQSDDRTLEVVADWQEHVGANLGQQVYDPCFSPHAYRNGKIHMIPDLYTTEMSACHRDLLADLKIRSKILVPILTVVDGSVPWGLISAIESHRARDWQTEEIALLQELATQMAIAIRQAIDYERVHNLNAELESRVAQRTAELQESQQFLQTVFDTFPLAVFWKDRESRYLGCNYNFAQAANLRSPAEIVGKTDYNLPWGTIEGDAYRADDRQVIDSGTAKLGIVETQTREDNTSIWLETNKLPLRNLNDEIIGVLGTYQEITERKSTEIQLQRLSKRLSLSLKSGAVGCWEWDILRDCLIWDERMYELYGVKKSSACEDVSFWLDTIHPEDRAATEDLLDRSLLGQADFDTEYRVIHPDGSIHFIKAYGLLEKVGQDLSYSMIGINFDITAAKHDEVIRQQNEHIIHQQAERESVLREITQRIRRSLDVKTIFETAVREIRQFMETDRVAILKFAADVNFDDDEFVAESVDPRFEPILGVKIPDLSCGEKSSRFHPQGRINVLENIHLGGLPAHEIEVLAKFQVQANLVVPLLNGQILWGSICIHHCAAPRSWQESEINFVNQIAEQIGIAIQQATLYEKVQLELEIRWQAEEAIALQLRQQQTLGSIAQQIRNSLKIEEILATATVQVKDLMMVDRVSIFRVFPNGHLQAVEEVVSPEYPSVIARNWENQYLSQEELEFYSDGQPHVVVDLQQDPWSLCLQAYMEEIHVQSKIVVPILLLSGNSDTDLDVDTWAEPHLWGLLSIQSCSSQRHWQQSESKLLQQIADQLAIAIHQANLFEKLQQELTERQQAQSRLLESNQQLAVSNQQLARATRLKDEFLASMSHELRTPLNAILGMSESLQDEVFGDLNERQHKSIATIEKSGKHLLALINDILDLSKIAANKFKLELTDVSIQSLCQNSILFIKELAHKRQIHLKIQVPEPLKHLNIRVDDLRFRQVLINLLSNAVKFTPEQGSITLDVRVLAGEIEGLVDGGIGGWGDRFVATTANPELIDRPSLAQPLRQIAFSIIDTGIGIAPENMDQLFESFVQIDSSLSRQYAGTGLGLSLVKRIVEMHQGHVSVQSEVNRGSCFTVSLPFCPSPAIVVPPSSLPLVHPLATDVATETVVMKSKTAILLVEDDEGTIETMTTYLDSRGYRLIVAENGQQAISLLKSCADALMPNHCPDIILMDIQMPGMDGFEAIGHIRQIPKCAIVPIIALTALAMPDDCQKCLDAGADRYMSKPVRLSQLVATIESLLKT